MIKGMQLLNNEREKDKEKTKNCPICSSNGDDGALCAKHAELSKNYVWLKNYINSQEKMNEKILYLLNFSISDRLSYIINDVPIVNGRIMIDEFLQKNMEFLQKNWKRNENYISKKRKKKLDDSVIVEPEKLKELENMNIRMKRSLYMEKMLKEILALQKARCSVIEMIKGK